MNTQRLLNRIQPILASLFLILLFSPGSMAQSENELSQEEEIIDIPDAHNSKGFEDVALTQVQVDMNTPAQKQAQSLITRMSSNDADAIKRALKPENLQPLEILKLPEKIQHSPACSSFIDRKGVPGPNARNVLNEITRPENADVFFGNGPGDFYKFSVKDQDGTPEARPPLCPNFKNFSESQKGLFWVWFFKSFAHFESSCYSAPAVHAKINNTIDGKIQSGTFDRGMLQLSNNRCKTTDDELNNPSTTLKCASKVLASEIRKRGNLLGDNSKIVTENSRRRVAEETHWGPLRKDDKLLKLTLWPKGSPRYQRSPESVCNSINLRNLIRSFPACGAVKTETICKAPPRVIKRPKKPRKRVRQANQELKTETPRAPANKSR